MRRLVARAAGLGAIAVVAAVASGRLPHLLVTQAAVSAVLTMLLAPLCLLDVGERSPLRRFARPFPSIALLAVGTVAIQLPPIVGAVADGGWLSGVAMIVLLLCALAFWGAVVSPARLSGIPAAAYVIVGGALISMPALLLVLSPSDLYRGFHSANPSAFDSHLDQLLSGFVLFGAVKVVIFVAFSVIFFSAARGEAAGAESEDDGGSRVPAPRAPLPGWVRDIVEGRPLPTVDEPSPATTAGRR